MKVSIKNIFAIAKKRGLKVSKINESRMIKSIQSDKGNFDYLDIAYDDRGDQITFSWRSVCLSRHEIRVQ